jgi:hypothetical protein
MTHACNHFTAQEDLQLQQRSHVVIAMGRGRQLQGQQTHCASQLQWSCSTPAQHVTSTVTSKVFKTSLLLFAPVMSIICCNQCTVQANRAADMHAAYRDLTLLMCAAQEAYLIIRVSICACQAKTVCPVCFISDKQPVALLDCFVSLPA